MYMNDRFEKELPNLHKWCNRYYERTGMRISAGNPPYGLILEEALGEIESLKAQLEALKPKKKESK